MKAVVLREVGQPTAVEDVTLRPVGDDEVRIRLAASGVCHTDLSVRDGAMPARLPCTLGHEGAGVVTEIGDGVTSVRAGDHVVLTWNVLCRRCPWCLRGKPQLCPHGIEHAFALPYGDSAGPVWPSMGAGALAEETLVPAAAAVPVDEALPFDQAALLGCAVITGVGAVLHTAGVRPGESVLVIGCGGVGLAAIQGARLAGAAQIIAADRMAGQLPAATANGATDTIDVDNLAALVSAVRDLTGGDGVDHAIEVVGKPATIRAAYDATRRGGCITVVGAAGFDETVKFPALLLMAEGKTIRGSVYGSGDPARDIPMLADLALRGRLEPEALVARRIGVAGVEAAFADMAAGHGARSVVCFGDSAVA